MNKKMIFTAVLALALASLACTINLPLPEPQTKTGPTVTEDVSVAYPQGTQSNFDVTMKFGAGKLTLNPGTDSSLVSGTAKYNVTDFKPEISSQYEDVTIEQGNLKLGGIPYINQDIVNEWDFSLGNQANRPYSLMIEAGAYTGKFELGGLALNRLRVTDGASKVNLDFSKPNQVEMTSFEYTTGASDVTLTGIANANVSNMSFTSGAGSYRLDFSGQMQRDMTVKIESGVSTVTVIIPRGVSAVLVNEGNLITVDASGDWQHQGTNYVVPGSGYSITINAKLGAGTLKLETK